MWNIENMSCGGPIRYHLRFWLPFHNISSVLTSLLFYSVNTVRRDNDRCLDTNQTISNKHIPGSSAQKVQPGSDYMNQGLSLITIICKLLKNSLNKLSTLMSRSDWYNIIRTIKIIRLHCTYIFYKTIRYKLSMHK